MFSAKCLEFRVEGVGFRFRIKRLEFRVEGVGFWIKSLEITSSEPVAWHLSGCNRSAILR